MRVAWGIAICLVLGLSAADRAGAAETPGTTWVTGVKILSAPRDRNFRLGYTAATSDALGTTVEFYRAWGWQKASRYLEAKYLCLQARIGKGDLAQFTSYAEAAWRRKSKNTASSGLLAECATPALPPMDQVLPGLAWMNGEQILSQQRNFRNGYAAGVSDLLSTAIVVMRALGLETAGRYFDVKYRCLQAKIGKGNLAQFTDFAEILWRGSNLNAASALLALCK